MAWKTGVCAVRDDWLMFEPCCVSSISHLPDDSVLLALRSCQIAQDKFAKSRNCVQDKQEAWVLFILQAARKTQEAEALGRQFNWPRDEILSSV